jgi:hypothetical protein
VFIDELKICGAGMPGACFINGDANEEKNIPQRLKPLVSGAPGCGTAEAMRFHNAFLQHAVAKESYPS